jgi:sigma-54-specific transcriptional regulator
MSNWLTYATELVVVRKPSQLAQLFTDIIQRELNLSTCLLMIPSADGRTLVPHRNERHELDLSWSVTDFDCPFAHVLQSATTFYVSSDELGFWRSNRSFSKLIEKVGMFDTVWINPLPLGAKIVRNILFAIGEAEKIHAVSQQEAFLRFVDVFVHQWTLLNEIQREEKYQRDLRESLVDIEKDKKQRHLLDKLSYTLIGKSDAMNRLREQIVSAASSQLSVMVQGETGTGKELVAQAVHDLSSRVKAPFVAINCAAIPENLLESELFGYCKGAFSGADSDKQGLIAQANGGTLFLDEIGDMPMQLQAKLLRVLETRQFRPVGGKQEETSDFRLVSATHVNLLQQVRQREFRQDLYYRLFQYPITLPRLAQRLDDIELLGRHFVSLFNQTHGRKIRGLNYKAVDALTQYDFPGNVRELKHLIEFGCAQTEDGTEVEASCLAHRLVSIELMESLSSSDLSALGQSEPKLDPEIKFDVINDLKQAIHDFEAKIISQRLKTFSGDRAKAAESLGIPKRTLAYKCQKLEI